VTATTEVIRELVVVPLAAITPSPRNPRSAENLNLSLSKLVQSIREGGLLSPITVRPIDEEKTHFEILAGERRFRACRELGHETIPAIVVSGLEESAAYAITVTENLQREDLTVLEESRAVAQLLELCQGNIAEAAARIGKPASWVARRNRLLNLSPEWKLVIGDETSPFSKWPASHLEVVARIPRAGQVALLEHYRAISTPPGGTNVPPLADLRRKVTARTHLLSMAPWLLTDPDLVPEAGSCGTCPKRSSCQPALFDTFRAEASTVRPDDLCLDTECWERKRQAFSGQAIRELLGRYPNLSFVSRSAQPSACEIAGRLVVAAHLLTKGAAGDPGCFPTVEVDDAGEVVNARVLWARFKHRSGMPEELAGAASPVAPAPVEEASVAAAIASVTGEAAPGPVTPSSIGDPEGAEVEECEHDADTAIATAPTDAALEAGKSDFPSRSPVARDRASNTPRARLEARRGMLAARLLRNQLTGKNAPSAPKLGVLLRLLAAFGTAQKSSLRHASASSSARTILSAWIDFERTKAAPDEELHTTLWKRVLEVLTDRLGSYTALQTYQHGSTAWKEVRAIVNTLGLDRESLEAEVAIQIPEPKSWQKAA
jgi:ParB/RepB/Spo0J family partition protein